MVQTLDMENSLMTLEERIDLHRLILREREQQFNSDNNTVESRKLLQKYIDEEKLIISELQQRLKEQ